MVRPTVSIGPADPKMAALIEWMKNPAGLPNPMQPQSRPLNLSDFSNGAPDPARSLEIPYAPAGNLGPLRDDTSAAYGALNPEPVPPSFVQPAAPDQGFVNQYAGQEPTRPTIQPASTLDKVIAALGGFGAGWQGRGAEYVAALRAERDRPIREYERQREDYEQRRTRGIELAERRSEREADAANRALESAYEREYRTWLGKNANRNDEAKERMRQAFITERDSRAARLEAERELQREQRRREDDARSIAGRLGTGPGAAPPAIAKELGAYYANITESLSPAAAKWQNAQARRADILAGRTGTGSGGRSVSNAAMRAYANFNGALQEVIGASQRGDVRGERLARRKLDVMHGRLSQFPRDIEAGIGQGGWPYAKLKGQSAPAPAGAPQAQGPSGQRAAAKAKLIGAGFNDAEAEAELNRLGIQ